jgi:hypothetical protein
MAARKRKLDSKSKSERQVDTTKVSTPPYGHGDMLLMMGKRTRITRSMTTDAARQAVFSTAELLEYILLFLPTKKIFVV